MLQKIKNLVIHSFNKEYLEWWYKQIAYILVFLLLGYLIFYQLGYERGYEQGYKQSFDDAEAEITLPGPNTKNSIDYPKLPGWEEF